MIASIVAGCGGTTGSSAPSASATAPSANPALRERLDWAVEQINGKAASLTAAEVSAQFAPSFLAIVPADQLIPWLSEMVIAAPYQLIDYSPMPDGNTAQGRVSSKLATFDVMIAVEPAAPNRILGILFTPASAATPTATWDEIDTAMALLAPQHSLYAAEVSDGSCRPIHATNADQSLAIGSTFKLYVLGELARQVSAGAASWDEKYAIRDEWKSIPSGTMQDEPAGTEHTLEQYARNMISISDNTATDHLIHRLGRQNVEAELAAMGMADTSRDIPFPTTREISLLKSSKFAALQKQYLAAGAAGRRKLLDGPIAATPFSVADMDDTAVPQAIDTLEWFASTRELCSAMTSLRAASGRPGPDKVMDILAMTPMLNVDKSVWAYTGVKAGSEQGVANVTWILRRADDRWFVVSLTLNDPTKDTGVLPAICLGADAISLLAVAP
jgi:beta-lactamase class A